jgi:hypothetical protein
MNLRRLIICSTVSICLLSSASFAANRPRKNPFKGTPLAAPHHGSYSTVTKKPVAKTDKPVKKVRFWNR